MVSNVLHLSEEEVVATLARIAHSYADDAEYQTARSELPKDWPF